MYSGRHYLQALLYHVVPEFSAMGPFLDYTCADLARAPYSRDSVRQFLAYALSPSYPAATREPEEYALRQLVQRELRKVEPLLEQPALLAALDAESDPLDVLTKTSHQALPLLRANGLPVDAPPLFLVDTFPAPYDRHPVEALCLDPGDHLAFGVQPGLYFLKDRLRPLRSRQLLLHELIHWHFGTVSPDLLEPGLEEGFCELLGAIQLSKETLGRTLTENLFIQGREGHTHRYLDDTRQAVCVLNLVDWDGLFRIAKNGREALETIEKALWLGDFDLIRQYRQHDRAAFHELPNHLCSVLSRNATCSPLAKYISLHTHAGDSVRELASRTGLEPLSVRKALSELQDDHGLAVLRMDKAVVTFSKCETISSPLTLRYAI
jgi:DNA-binding transcriptional ArsR family regulator